MEYQTRQGSQSLKPLSHWTKSRDMEKIVKLVLWIIDHFINTSNNLKRGNTLDFVICVIGEIAVCMYILPCTCFTWRYLIVNLYKPTDIELYWVSSPQHLIANKNVNITSSFFNSPIPIILLYSSCNVLPWTVISSIFFNTDFFALLR